MLSVRRLDNSGYRRIWLETREAVEADDRLLIDGICYEDLTIDDDQFDRLWDGDGDAELWDYYASFVGRPFWEHGRAGRRSVPRQIEAVCFWPLSDRARYVAQSKRHSFPI